MLGMWAPSMKSKALVSGHYVCTLFFLRREKSSKKNRVTDRVSYLRMSPKYLILE
jgi:hypothetical protein